jgi:DNA topoisomerase III
LGFVVERHNQNVNFVPESFYYIGFIYRMGPSQAKFAWKKDRMDDKAKCEKLFKKV